MSAETRERILIAATAAFVAPDAGGPALRAIARAGGVNSALIHYHFGSRDGLFEAALLHALAPIQARRDAGLADLRGAVSADGSDLARLCVRPLCDPGSATVPPLGHDDRTALQLLARATSEAPARVEALTLKHFAPSLFALRDVLSTALPALSADTKRARFRLATAAALSTLASPDPAAPDTANLKDRARARVAEVERFLAGALDAPE